MPRAPNLAGRAGQPLKLISVMPIWPGRSTVSGGMMCRDYPKLSVKTKSINTPGRIESRTHSY